MKDTTYDAIKKTGDLYKEFHGTGDGRINIWFQFRSVATCSEELIRGVAEKAREYNTGLHTHLSEYNETILYTLGKYGIREVEFLDRLGAVGPNLLAAHSILVNERDLEILKDRDVKIIHCPRSNLGKGFTKTPQMLGMGMSVGLGTDGTAHSGLSMFKEMTAFRHSQIAQWGVPYFDSSVMPTKTLINLATLGGAKAVQLDKQIGSLEIGKKADLIMINIDQPHIIPTHNLLNTLTETVETNDIVDMIVNGKILMENREVCSIDEEKLMFEAKSHYKKILDINDWDDKLAVGEI
jgi:5-methylthioadenosine/S-adenosylhomocysteine deaminase